MHTNQNKKALALSPAQKELALIVLGYALLLAVIVVVFNKVLMLNLIPSGSMEGAIETGSVVIANRLDCEDIQRYDIMVFHSPKQDAGEKELYIKRVIGLPGETVTIVGGKVYAGTELLDDSFLPEEMWRKGSGVYQVPEGCYFMLGDNRNYSCDSRFWEDGSVYKNQYVPREDMVAKAAISIWPLRQAGSLAYHEDASQAQEADFEGIDCVICGADCLVDVDVIGHAGMNENGGIKWVVDGTVLHCLNCGSEQVIEKEADAQC